MTVTDMPPAPRRMRWLWPLIMAVLALVAGAGAFYATWSGALFAPHGDDVAELPDLAFVPVDPVVISLPEGAQAEYLRFTAQLEVNAPHQAEVAGLMPRILDILNGYLRAIDVAELEDPAALIRIRAQLLRRIQIVTGDGRVRDLLVTEFVLN